MTDKTWCLYVLNCGNSHLYTGITNDLAKRISNHKAGKGAKFTKRFKGDLVCVYTCELLDKSQALKVELAFKKLSKPKKQKIIIAELGEKELLSKLGLDDNFAT